MALINLVGFETGDASELNAALTGTASIQSTTKHAGTYALKVNPTTTATGFADIALAYGAGGTKSNNNNAQSWYRFYFLFVTAPGSNDEEIFMSDASQVANAFGGSPSFSLRLNSAKKLVAYDATPTLLATGATVLNASTWYRIEVKVDRTNTAWEVRINGVSEISGSNALGSFGPIRVGLGKTVNRNGQTVEFYFDDLAISNSAYPSDGQIAVLKANGNGNYTAWTGTFTDVDELPPDGDTTIITSSTNLQAETETMEDSSVQSISGTINAVKNLGIIGNNSTTVSVILRLRSSTTDNDTTGASSTPFLDFAKIYETDPATSAAWITGGIDGAESGVVHNQSQVRQAKCTALYLMVDFLPAIAADLPFGRPTLIIF